MTADVADRVLALVNAWASGDPKRFHSVVIQTAAKLARSGDGAKARQIRDLADRALAERLYLPPYSGAHGYCTKCEFGAVTLKYQIEDGVDFLERECGRCHYVWYEKCADAEKNYG